MTASRGTDESFAALFEQTAGSQGARRRFHPGDSLEVTIVAVGRDAVFADLGGKQEGIFERPELCDAEGKLRVEVGSRVTAVVDAVDSGTGQARLRPVRIRAESGDVPAAMLTPAARSSGPALAEGARVKGQVTGVERYGVFVQIAGTHGRSGRGLIPTAETGTPRGADLKKHFAAGQEVETKILNIDETGRIRLSVSALGADDERGLFEAYKTGQGPAAAGTAPGANAAPAAAAKQTEKPAVRGFGTLADLLPKGIAAAPKPASPAPQRAAPAPVVETGRRRLAPTTTVSPSSRSRPNRAR